MDWSDDEMELDGLDALFDEDAAPRPPAPVCHFERLSDDLLRAIFLLLPQVGCFFRVNKRFHRCVRDNLPSYLAAQYGTLALPYLIGYGSLCTPGAIDIVLASGAVLSRKAVQALFAAYARAPASASDRYFYGGPPFDDFPIWGSPHSGIPFASYLHILRLADQRFPHLNLFGDDAALLVQALQWSRHGSTRGLAGRPAVERSGFGTVTELETLDTIDLVMHLVKVYGMATGWPMNLFDHLLVETGVLAANPRLFDFIKLVPDGPARRFVGWMCPNLTCPAVLRTILYQRLAFGARSSEQMLADLEVFQTCLRSETSPFTEHLLERLLAVIGGEDDHNALSNVVIRLHAAGQLPFSLEAWLDSKNRCPILGGQARVQAVFISQLLRSPRVPSKPEYDLHVLTDVLDSLHDRHGRLLESNPIAAFEHAGLPTSSLLASILSNPNISSAAAQWLVTYIGTRPADEARAIYLTALRQAVRKRNARCPVHAISTVSSIAQDAPEVARHYSVSPGLPAKTQVDWVPTIDFLQPSAARMVTSDTDTRLTLLAAYRRDFDVWNHLWFQDVISGCIAHLEWYMHRGIRMTGTRLDALILAGQHLVCNSTAQQLGTFLDAALQHPFSEAPDPTLFDRRLYSRTRPPHAESDETPELELIRLRGWRNGIQQRLDKLDADFRQASNSSEARWAVRSEIEFALRDFQISVDRDINKLVIYLRDGGTTRPALSRNTPPVAAMPEPVHIYM